MRALLPIPAPAGAVDDEDTHEFDVRSFDVHEFYARDWLEPGGLRVNFVSSVDGAATAEGASAGLQTPGDNQVFAALRDLADVVLVGAGTVRTEGYHKVRVSERRLEIRRRYGLADTVPIAVVSRSLRLDPDADVFADPSGPRTLVLTCAAGDPAVRDALAERAEVISCGEEDVDLAAARSELESRGLTRILSEGGPTLFGDLARTGVMDELCLSITPFLAGPGAMRIVSGELWPGEPRRLRLNGLLEEDGALFCRYRVTS